jgi:hypothetical protein
MSLGGHAAKEDTSMLLPVNFKELKCYPFSFWPTLSLLKVEQYKQKKGLRN